MYFVLRFITASIVYCQNTRLQPISAATALFKTIKTPKCILVKEHGAVISPLNLNCFALYSGKSK